MHSVAMTFACFILLALGIATVYCIAAFSFTIVGGALASGIRSPADASAKLESMKKEGPVS